MPRRAEDVMTANSKDLVVKQSPSSEKKYVLDDKFTE